MAHHLRYLLYSVEIIPIFFRFGSSFALFIVLGEVCALLGSPVALFIAFVSESLWLVSDLGNLGIPLLTEGLSFSEYFVGRFGSPFALFIVLGRNHCCLRPILQTWGRSLRLRILSV